MASFVRMAGGATILMALVAVGDASSCVIQACDIRVEGLAQRTPSDVVAVGTATPSLSWVVSEQGRVSEATCSLHAFAVGNEDGGEMSGCWKR